MVDTHLTAFPFIGVQLLSQMPFLSLSQSRPPLYDLTAMKVPTAIWAAGRDMLITPKDIDRILPQIRNLRYFKLLPDWNHFDFIWGLDAPQRVYNKIIALMREYL